MQAEEMRTKAGGTWITPTIVIGEEVGLGFDPEWMKARIEGWAALKKRHRCA